MHGPQKQVSLPLPLALASSLAGLAKSHLRPFLGLCHGRPKTLRPKDPKTLLGLCHGSACLTNLGEAVVRGCQPGQSSGPAAAAKYASHACSRE